MTFTTADLWDEHGDRLQSCEAQFKQYGGVQTFDGPAATVVCFEDNALLKKVLSTPGEGRVLVVSGGGSLRTALMGDMIATIAVDHGWAGIIIHGAVRDVRILATVPLGIKALGSNPRKSAKTGAGTAGIPVAFGGAIIRPGDYVYSDDDGIVVLPSHVSSVE